VSRSSEERKHIELTRYPVDYKLHWFLKLPSKRFGFDIKGETSKETPLEDLIGGFEMLDNAVISGEMF